MKRITLIIALIIGSRAAIADNGSGKTAWQKLPVQFKALDNLVYAGDMLRLKRQYQQTADQPIAFEAEEATVIKLRNRDERIVDDKEASGGGYLQHVSHMEYRFEVETPGDYQVHLLAYFPLKGSWMHRERMDDGEVKGIFDSKKGEPKVWTWTTGPVYTLTKGSHNYIFPAPTAFCGGARLDKVVLMPVGKEIELAELGPSASKQVNPDQGVATSKRIKLARIKSWKVAFDINNNAGTVNAEYSYDHKTWQTLTPAKDYTLSSPKPDYLWLRFSIKAAADRPSPWIQGIACFIVQDDKPSVNGGKRYVRIN